MAKSPRTGMGLALLLALQGAAFAESPEAPETPDIPKGAEPAPPKDSAPAPQPGLIERLQTRESPLQDNELQTLQKYAESEQFEKGYDEAKYMLETWEGSLAFDFYYGLFALETNHYDEATFTFERLVTSQPGNIRYRLELARALYYNNNLEAAKREFKNVLEEQPPGNVKRRIEAIIRDIDARLRRRQSIFYLALDVDSGYDSNINNATNEDFIESPLGGTIPTADIEGAQAIDSGYGQLKTQAIYSQPFSFHQGIDFSFSSMHKRNSEIDSFDLDLINLDGTYGWQFDQWRLRAGAAASHTRLAGETLFNQYSAIGDAVYTTRGQWSISTGLNLGNRSSELETSPNMKLFSLAFNVGLPPSPRKTALVSILYNKETVSGNELKHFGKSSFSLGYQHREKHSRTLVNNWGLSLTTFNYDDTAPLFDQSRVDTLINGGYGWEWLPWKYLALKLNGTVSYNSSNIGLYSYPRLAIEAGIRLQY